MQAVRRAVGRWRPLLRRLRRPRGGNGDTAAAASFTGAIISLREQSTPYHLAHGLLDHARYLTGLSQAEAAARALGEARDIAGRLRCGPLLHRAADLTPAAPPLPAPTA